MWLQSSHGKHTEKRVSTERGTSDAAPRSRHQKKALCFQAEYPRGSTLPWGRSVGSLLGFLRRPLQTGLRHLRLWRVITSVSSPYIPMLTYISLLMLIQLKTTLLRLILWHFFASCLESYCLLSVASPASSAYTEKNYEIFLWMDMKHWNVTLPTTGKINRDRSDCQISTKLSRCDCFWLLLFYIFRHLFFFFFVSSLQYFSWVCDSSSDVELLVH